jgi:hypothetical protein
MRTSYHNLDLRGISEFDVNGDYQNCQHSSWFTKLTPEAARQQQQPLQQCQPFDPLLVLLLCQSLLLLLPLLTLDNKMALLCLLSTTMVLS